MRDGAKLTERTAPPQSLQVDYKLIKRSERPFGNGRYLRFVLLGLCCLLYFFTHRHAGLFLWFGVFMGVQLLHRTALRSLPDFGPARLMWRIIATQVLGGVVYMAPGIWLWIYGTETERMFSLLMLVGGALNTMAVRSALPVQTRVDVLVVAVSMLARLGWMWWDAPREPGTWLITVALLSLFVYFLKALAELRMAHDRLGIRLDERHATERQRELVQFTGGVAHDFNNLLTVVLGNMELARLSEASDERDALMDEAARAARRGAQLTDRLLAVSRRLHLEPVSESPALLIAPLQDVAPEVLGQQHALRVEMEDNLQAVHVDPVKFQAALLELMSNARDAMIGGGEIVLTVGPSPLNPRQAVRFTVTDSGPGIPAHLQATVFEPYFTTKPRGRGSGLGLPTVRGFVEQSNGELGLKSAPGQGTRIWFDLPAVPPGAAQARMNRLRDSDGKRRPGPD